MDGGLAAELGIGAASSTRTMTVRLMADSGGIFEDRVKPRGLEQPHRPPALAVSASMVHVPSPEEEDAKRPHREREYLVQEKLRIENRIAALLFTQGIWGRPLLRSWEPDIAELRTGDGCKLPGVH